jgi:hypothetical protein
VLVAKLILDKATELDAGGEGWDYKCLARNKYSYDLATMSIYFKQPWEP